MAVVTAVGIGTAAVGAYSANKAAKKQAAASTRNAQLAADAARFEGYDQRVGGNTVSFQERADGTKFVTSSLSGANKTLKRGFDREALLALDNDATDSLQTMGADAVAQMQGDPAALRQARMDQGLAEEGHQSSVQSRIDGRNNQLASLGQNVQNTLGGAGRADAAANFGIARGQQLLGQDFQGVADNQLALMRAQARPMEDRAVNSKMGNLFARGTLGGTSGVRAMGELAMNQENADISRQLASQNFAQAQMGQNLNAGTALLGQGQAGLLSGQQANAQTASTMSNTGIQNIGAQNQSDVTNLGITQQGGDRAVSRVGARITDAQNLFGFGQDAQAGQLDLAATGANNSMNQDTNLRNLIALGGNIGGTAASAGAQQASALLSAKPNTTNAFGSIVQGAGATLLDKAINQFT